MLYERSDIGPERSYLKVEFGAALAGLSVVQPHSFSSCVVGLNLVILIYLPIERSISNSPRRKVPVEPRFLSHMVR